MKELQKQLEESLAKREEFLLAGHNDEILNDLIKELKCKIEKFN